MREKPRKLVSVTQTNSLYTTDAYSECTRRSAKRSQAVQPPLERRGALRDLASQTANQTDTGVVRGESPSSPRERRSVSAVIRSVM